MLTNWLTQNAGSIYIEMLLLFCLALAILTIGFYRFLYFISIGYAFLIVAMAVITPLRYIENLSLASALQNLFLVLWGLRLGIYLVRREFQAAYRKRNTETHQSFAGIPWRVKTIVWVSVSLLYVLMFSPSLFLLTGTPATSSWILPLSQGAGLLLMGGGLILESIADKQKSNFKTQFPKQYCDVGLYRWVRCPNYLGEIMFWVGNWVIGILFYTTAMKWVGSLVGMVCIVLIMMGATKRLEKAQDERYGSQPDYQKYIRSVPVLFPYIPVYSLKNVRVFIE